MFSKKEKAALAVFLLLATLLAFIPMGLSNRILVFGAMAMCGGYAWGHIRARCDMQGDCRQSYQTTRQPDQNDHLRR